AYARIDARNAVDEEIGVRQIEARIETKRHHAGRRVDERCTGDHAENGVLFIGAQRMHATGELDDLVEVLALNPELEFAGSVAGVIAGLEGRDDDGADGPGLLGVCGEGEEDGEKDTGAEEAHAGSGGIGFHRGVSRVAAQISDMPSARTGADRKSVV